MKSKTSNNNRPSSSSSSFPSPSIPSPYSRPTRPSTASPPRSYYETIVSFRSSYLALFLAIISYTLFFHSSYSYSTQILITLLVLYIPFYIDSSELVPLNSRVSPVFQRLPLFSSLLSYFPATIRLDAGAPRVFPSSSMYIIAGSPHGTTSLSHFSLMTSGAVPSALDLFPFPRRDLAASILFRIPLLRDILLALGNIDASAPIAHKALEKGLSLFLYPGGEAEQLLTDSAAKTITLVHRNRRGFIRLALSYSCRIVPIYTFGEEAIYSTSSFLLPLRQYLSKKYRVALPIFWGHWLLPLLPHPVPLTSVVGKPIITNEEGEAIFNKLKKLKESDMKDPAASSQGSPMDNWEDPVMREMARSPFREGDKLTARKVEEKEVDRVLELYCGELIEMFNRNKETVPGNYKDYTLKII